MSRQHVLIVCQGFDQADGEIDTGGLCPQLFVLSVKDIYEVQPTVYVNGIPLIQDNPFIYNKQSYSVNPAGPATSLLSTLSLDNIDQIRVIKDYKDAALLGPFASNGAIYITTKSFARDSYWNYFKSKSPEYKDKVPDLKIESKVTYILNNKILRTNFEADLFQIDDTNFLSLQVITGKQLKNDYKVSGKSIGVVITTKMKEGKND